VPSQFLRDAVILLYGTVVADLFSSPGRAGVFVGPTYYSTVPGTVRRKLLTLLYQVTINVLLRTVLQYILRH
jgi:hypothetical protein